MTESDSAPKAQMHCAPAGTWKRVKLHLELKYFDMKDADARLEMVNDQMVKILLWHYRAYVDILWLLISLGVIYCKNMNRSMITWDAKKRRVLIKVDAEVRKRK